MKLERLVRDIGEGILVVDNSGTIIQISPSAQRLLGYEKSLLQQKYAMLMSDDSDDRNDSFHQVLLDALRDKRAVQHQRVPYYTPDGVQHWFEMTCSVLLGEDGREKEGVILSFSDVSEEYTLKQQKDEAAVVFVSLLTTICVWIFIYAIWQAAGQPVSGTALSKWMVILVLIPSLHIGKMLSLGYRDLGLEVHGIRKAVHTDILITAAAIGVMCLVKLVMMRIRPEYFPAGSPFIRWNKYPFWEYPTYIISVLFQEFVSRGVVHGCLRRIVPGRNQNRMAILISSLTFGALHVHLGLVYMVGAALLLGVLGLIYDRQKTIWGLCIPHYVLGMLLGLMDFVAY